MDTKNSRMALLLATIDHNGDTSKYYQKTVPEVEETKELGIMQSFS